VNRNADHRNKQEKLKIKLRITERRSLNRRDQISRNESVTLTMRKNWLGRENQKEKTWKAKR
jgi:hypothetical protein